MKVTDNLSIYLRVGMFNQGEIVVSALDFDQESCAQLEYLKIGEQKIELDIEVPDIDFELARKQLQEQKKIARMAKLQEQMDKLSGEAA